jgi:hypothetical protein
MRLAGAHFPLGYSSNGGMHDLRRFLVMSILVLDLLHFRGCDTVQIYKHREHAVRLNKVTPHVARLARRELK